VKLYRDHKLKDAVANSDACMQGAFGHLRNLGRTLDHSLQFAEERHDDLVASLAKRHGTVDLAQGLALGDAFQLANGDDAELAAIRRGLATYRSAIDKMADAHHKLALLADSKASEAAVNDALGNLEASILDLLEVGR
jgi:hypothetical protein